MSKQCTKCNSTKHIDDFYNKHKWCKSCDDKCNREYKAKNSKVKKEYLDLFREQRLKYISENCPNFSGHLTKYQHYPLILQGPINFLLHHDLGKLITFKHTENVKQRIAAYYKAIVVS